MQIFNFAERPFMHFVLKTVVNFKFATSPRNPLGISCASDGQNCGKIDIFYLVVTSWGGLLFQNCGEMDILGRTGADCCFKTVVKWTFLGGLWRAIVENRGETVLPSCVLLPCVWCKTSLVVAVQRCRKVSGAKDVWCKRFLV